MLNVWLLIIIYSPPTVQDLNRVWAQLWGAAWISVTKKSLNFDPFRKLSPALFFKPGLKPFCSKSIMTPIFVSLTGSLASKCKTVSLLGWYFWNWVKISNTSKLASFFKHSIVHTNRSISLQKYFNPLGSSLTHCHWLAEAFLRDCYTKLEINKNDGSSLWP